MPDDRPDGPPGPTPTPGQGAPLNGTGSPTHQGGEPHSPGGAPTDYPLAPLLVARFVGLALVLLAVVMFAGTALVALTGAPPDLLVVVLVLGVVGVFVLGWWLRSRTYVVRCGEDGYRVRLVRGAGIKEARWTAVEDAVAASPRGVDCVVLRLKNGGTTTIPVDALAIDREQFVRELQQHLQRGQGLRRL